MSTARKVRASGRNAFKTLGSWVGRVATATTAVKVLAAPFVSYITFSSLFRTVTNISGSVGRVTSPTPPAAAAAASAFTTAATAAAASPSASAGRSRRYNNSEVAPLVKRRRSNK